MTGPRLERDEAPPAPESHELTARARGWRIATWIAAGVVVALVVYLLLRSSDTSATPAAASAGPPGAA